MAQLKISNALWPSLFNLAPNVGVIYSIYIMQGGMPSPPEITATTSWSSSRSPDILLQYTGITASTIVTNNTVSIVEVPYVAATRTGTATWAVVNIAANSSGGSPGRIIVGDVTDAYGNGFLQMNDTDIVVGEKYKILALQMTMAWEYNF